MPVVFVVDDDVSIREALEAVIRHAGLHVETFASAREFLGHFAPGGTGCPPRPSCSTAPATSPKCGS